MKFELWERGATRKNAGVRFAAVNDMNDNFAGAAFCTGLLSGLTA